MSEETKPKRRSHFRCHVARKLKYSIFMGGGKDNRERAGYVVLSRCGKPWRYWLFPTDNEADLKLGQLNVEKCWHGCQGPSYHSRWLEIMPPR